MKRLFVVLVAAVSALALFSVGCRVFAGETKEVKSGVVVGVVTAKGEDWIEVKADKSKKTQRYIPFFTVGMIQDGKGGAPQLGGQYDAGMVKELSNIPVGSRVELSWQAQENKLCIVSIKKK